MRVLHVIPSLAPCHGGPSVVLPIIERALTAEGINVETLTTDDDGPGRRNDRGDGCPREENGVLRRYFPKQTEFYKVSLPLASWLRREVRNYELVHVHAMFSHTSIAACRAARAVGVPYVIRPLGVLTRYGITQRRALLKQLSLRWVEGPLLRDAAAVHFTLPMEQSEAEALGVAFNPVVVPLGLESQPLPAPTAGRVPSVLFLSRVDPKKNLEGLLEAWAQVGYLETDPRSRNPGIAIPWKLVIAGSGTPEYERSLRARSESLGISHCVEWAGQVAGLRKSQLLADAEIFVLPSFSENFGIAAAEAMLAGKACVFSPGVAVGAVAAHSDAARLGGPDVASLARELAALMADPSAREQLGNQAMNYAKNELSAKTMGTRLKAMYEALLAGRTTL